MKLRDHVLVGLAEMVTGDNGLFPYRSSSHITRFFERCGFGFVHDGSTRKWWTKERLAELNEGPGQAYDLPSDDLLLIISELFDADEFDRCDKKLEPGLDSLTQLLVRSGLAPYFDASGRCYLRNTGSGVDSAMMPQRSRPVSTEERAQRQRLTAFLDSASEDQLTEQILVPLFRRLGFHRVSAAGHKEKVLEFGKDLWMKYQLPTGHWLYFCAQVKKEKIDTRGASSGQNVATILSQAKMALEHPIFDPDSNQRVLLDHLFLISAGEITRAARAWLIERLDSSQRRHIIFMDREELLDHSARILLGLQVGGQQEVDADDVPF